MRLYRFRSKGLHRLRILDVNTLGIHIAATAFTEAVPLDLIDIKPKAIWSIAFTQFRNLGHDMIVVTGVRTKKLPQNPQRILRLGGRQFALRDESALPVAHTPVGMRLGVAC